MNAQAAAGARAGALAPSRTLADRFLAALPLLSVFFWLALVYGWQSWDHPTPWVFGDELELTQLARSIAATGHAARRGAPHAPDSVYAYLTAPAWWLGSVHSAYAAVKYAGVVAMAATAFPAYFLARLVASPRASLVAAAGAAAIPSLAYSSFIVEEPFAYPWATLCLFLAVKALLVGRRGWIAAAVLASLVAPFVKGELGVIPAVLVLAGLFLAWGSGPVAAWRAGWTRGDWAGWVTLLSGAVVLLAAVASWRSFEFLAVSRFWKGRMIDLGLDAGGALTIGLGIVPLLVAFGILVPARGERRTRALRAFRCVLLAALIGFGLYTSVKAAYNSITFATRVWERNLIYLSPLFMAALAVWLDRRRLSLLGLGIGSGLAAYLLATTPYEMQNHLSSDAPGLAILSQANRLLAFTPRDAEIALYVVLALGTAALAAVQLRRVPRAAAAAIAAATALFVVGWNLTGEISAGAASNSISHSFLSNIRNPVDWVDRVTHGAPTIYLAQREQLTSNQDPEWLLEFWNRSIQRVWVLGGCICGPGPTTTPDVKSDSGVLKPQLGFPYVVVEPGIDVAGTLLAQHAHKAGGGFARWRLYRIRQPLRLLGAVTGVYPDGWSEPGVAAYTRYGGSAGTMRVTVSRKLWGGPERPYRATIRIGTLAIGPDRQPRIGRVTSTRTLAFAHNYDERTVALATPGPRFRVEVSVDRTFVPAKLLPSVTSDARELGAVVGFRFAPRKAAHR